MKLLTKELQDKLVRNHQQQDGTKNFKPVVKLFNPVGSATWLLSELNPVTHIAFGLCDLGMGFPELGYVSLEELQSVTLPMGLKIERDCHWSADKTLTEYAAEADEHGRIVA
jgi:hypothetical protein